MASRKITLNASNNFASRLSGLIERYGVRQSAIATRLDVSQAAVSGWVNGKIPVRRTARALAGIFGVRVDWLLYGRGDQLEPGQPEAIIADLPIKQSFKPRLSERSYAPLVVGLDAIALREVALKLEEASAALGSCAKIIAKSAGQNRPQKAKKRN
jgi:transcriptional regulator with XRE-family HTH domain